MVVNKGSTDPLSVKFTLTGDTNQFRIVAVNSLELGGSQSTCLPQAVGGVVSSDGTTATPCLVEPPTTGTGWYGMVVRVRFAPSVYGTYNATLTQTSNNNTVVDAPLALTAISKFDATATWAGDSAGATSMPVAQLNYGSAPLGNSVEKAFFVVNKGATGAQSVAFNLTGDTSQFKITKVGSLNLSGQQSTCLPQGIGGVVSTDGTTSTPCLVEPPSTGSGWYGSVVYVKYSPTVAGNHNATITQTSNNGTTVDVPVTLQGVGLFGAKAQWSGNSQGTVAFPASSLAYGIQALGTQTDKTIFVVNKGTQGAQSVGFTLSGDTGQFQLVKVNSLKLDGSQSTCLPSGVGGVVSADKLSSTPCLVENVTTGTGWYGIALYVRYAPKSTGQHSITVTPNTNNTTALPTPLTFTGSAQ
jgi:hypothetical protein